LGQATAYAISKASGIKRPTVYVVLEELREQEAVLKIPYAKKQVYIAKSPELLVAKASANIQSIKNYLPILLGLMPKERSPRVLFFEGQKDMHQLLWHPHQTGVHKELVGFYACNKNVSHQMMELVHDYNRHLQSQHIRTRGIVPDHPSLRAFRQQDAAYGRTMKVVPVGVYNSTISVDIGQNFVRLIDYGGQQGIVIEHLQITDALRQVFEMVWRSLK
jgi:hypothetical protein